MKAPEAPQEVAEIKSKENTKEWHTEVIGVLKDGKAIEGLKPESAQASAARAALEKPEVKESVHYLMEKGVPKSDIVAVVVSEIAESKFRDDPTYLVAKEAQLVYSMRSDMVLDEQAEIGKVVQQLHERISVLHISAGEPS